MVPIRHDIRSAIASNVTPRIAYRKTSAAETALPETTASTVPGSASSSPTDSPATDAVADFRTLFGGNKPAASTPTAAPAQPAKQTNPTVQSVFGSNVYIADPGGVAPNGVAYTYNPQYFATRSTADKLAQMYGGTVVEQNALAPYCGYQQTHMNEMIRFSNGNVINAGLLASYYNQGWSQAQVDKAILAEINQVQV
jgi:hypothetical protein